MKKALLTALICFFMTASAGADFNIQLSGGYSWLTFAELNNDINALMAWSIFYPDNRVVTESNNAIFTNIDFTFSVIPSLSAGARVGYMYAIPASYEGQNTALTWNTKTTYEPYLLTIMAGDNFTATIPNVHISIISGFYAGYGMASIKMKRINTTSGSNSEGTVTYSGSGFAADAFTGFEYHINRMFSIGLTAGYKLAYIEELKAENTSTNTSVINVLKDDNFMDLSNNVIPLNFSGLNAGLNIKITF